MQLLRPQVIDTRKKVRIENVFTIDLTEHLIGVTFKKSLSVLFLSEARMENLNEPVELKFDTIDPPKNKLNYYLAVQTLMKICAENGEDINRRLLKINKSFMGLTKEEQKVVPQLDFMKLKDRFVEYLKKDKTLSHLPEYSDASVMKKIRQNFDAFILDRNIYTHGYMHLLSPNYEPVIEYIHNIRKEKTYARITVELLQSYNNFYMTLSRLCDDFINVQRGKAK